MARTADNEEAEETRLLSKEGARLYRLNAVVALVAAWLLGIIVNLLLIPGYFDVALRDFGLALGALALARLSVEFEGRPIRA